MRVLFVLLALLPSLVLSQPIGLRASMPPWPPQGPVRTCSNDGTIVTETVPEGNVCYFDGSYYGGTDSGTMIFGTTTTTPGLSEVLDENSTYTGADSVANAVYIGNATNGMCHYTDGSNVPQARACNAAKDTFFSKDWGAEAGDDPTLRNEDDVACLTWDSETVAFTVATTGDCAEAFTIFGDLTVSGTITATTGLNVAGTTCISASSDRLYHDTDCDGTKDGGEEFIDQAGGGSADDTAFGVGWNASTLAPTQNAVYDQMILKATLAAPTFTGVVTVPTEVYGAGWNADPAAADRDAVYDQMELRAPLASPTFTGTVVLPASQALTTPVLTAPSGTVGITAVAATPYTLLQTDCGKWLSIATGAGEIDLLADMTGCQVCLYQLNAVATVLDPNSTDTWLVGSYNTENGTALAPSAGDSITLAAVADNALCLLGVSATQVRLLPGTLGAVTDTN